MLVLTAEGEREEVFQRIKAFLQYESEASILTVALVPQLFPILELSISMS